MLLVTAAISVFSYLAFEVALPNFHRRKMLDGIRIGSSFYGDIHDGVPVAAEDAEPDSLAIAIDSDIDAASSAEALQWLPKVKSVCVRRQVTDIGIETLLSSLAATAVSGMEFRCEQMTDKALVNIGKLKSLKNLWFFSSSITDASLKRLKDVKGLKILLLWEAGRRQNSRRFGVSGFEGVGQLKNLTKLGIRGHAISNDSVRKLHSLTELKQLYFSYCIISETAISELRTVLPTCEIDVFYCEEPSTPSPDGIVTTPRRGGR
jgi:hypothetical protein